MKIKDYTSDEIHIPDFKAGPGQAWCILGGNRSGIDGFFRLLAGDCPEDSRVRLSKGWEILSFAGQQALFEQELKKDDTDFMDRIDPGTPARDFLRQPEAHEDLIRAFAMEKVLDHGYRQLSTGQSRKLLLLAAITRKKTGLLIQAPYEGLDRAACRELDHALHLCLNRGMGIILTVHNPGDIPDWATHIGVMDRGCLVSAGSVRAFGKDFPRIQAAFKASVDQLMDHHMDKGSNGLASEEMNEQELIRIENGSAGYHGKTVFSGLNLTIRNGEHTLITGPNGCGKSTLLQIITGDHQACYTNRLWIFGIRRGTGESIWELKKKMGIVSPDLHRTYIVPGSVLECLMSGLFDSIGLYTRPGDRERKRAMTWLDRISMTGKAGVPFRSLSYADQRLVLIARALIKLPDLLVLDEPTQGLDQANREAILDFLGHVAEEGLSTIVYVSHREDEFRPFFVSRLDMTPSSAADG